MLDASPETCNKALEREIRQIVARAEPLEWRWWNLDKCEIGAALDIADWIDSWRAQNVDEGEDRFEFRLSLDKIDQAVATDALKVTALKASEPLPEWGDLLMRVILRAAEMSKQETTAQTFQLAERFPFTNFMEPFRLVGRDLIAEQAAGCEKMFADSAMEMSDAFLFYRLHKILGLPLSQVFFRFKSAEQENARSGTISGASNSVHDDFISAMLSHSMLSFFKAFPVAGRLAAVVLEMWVDNFVALARRLEEDKRRLEEFAGVNVGTACVDAIDFSGSDPHNGGKTVGLIRFTDGKRLVYKPRGHAIDVAYNDLLRWLNGHGAPVPLKTYGVLDRGEYGWTEFIEYRFCQSAEEAKGYYRNSGALLCMLFILGTSDIHKKNIIASGEDPVLIDTETLLQPCARLLEQALDVFRIGHEMVRDSVLSVGLLPAWFISRVKDKPDTAWDLSGLGGIDEFEDVLLFPHWKNPDSDKMELSYLPGKAHLSKNAVIQDGNLHQPSDYVSEIIDGFTRTYGFLTGIKEDLLALDSPIMAFKNKEIRVVLRNTNLYVRMLYRLCNSHFLRDGSAWSIDLDVLSQAFTKRSCTTAAEAPHYWEIFTDERAAMNVNDVPFFTANSSATSLFLSGGRKVRDFYVEPSFAGMVKRLEELDERDMARQVDFIKGSLFSRGEFISRIQMATSPIDAADPLAHAGKSPLEEKVVLEICREIAESLQERAIRSPDGGVVWISPYGSSVEFVGELWLG